MTWVMWAMCHAILIGSISRVVSESLRVCQVGQCRTCEEEVTQTVLVPAMRIIAIHSRPPSVKTIGSQLAAILQQALSTHALSAFRFVEPLPAPLASRKWCDLENAETLQVLIPRSQKHCDFYLDVPAISVKHAATPVIGTLWFENAVFVSCFFWKCLLTFDCVWPMPAELQSLELVSAQLD